MKLASQSFNATIAFGIAAMAALLICAMATHSKVAMLFALLTLGVAYVAQYLATEASMRIERGEDQGGNAAADLFREAEWYNAAAGATILVACVMWVMGVIAVALA